MILHIDLSETIETLEEVSSRANLVEADQVLDGLLINHYDTQKIRQLQSEINSFKERLKKDSFCLQLFAQTYNKQFQSDNFQFCNTVKCLYEKIKGTLKNSMIIYRKLAKRKNTRAGIINGEIHNPLTMRRSAIGNGTTYPFIYNREEWGIEANALCESIEEFFSQLKQLVHICLDLLKEEDFIRNNPFIVTKIYNDSFNEAKKGLESIILDNIDRQISSIDLLTQNRIDCKDESEFAKKWFHKCNEDSFNIHVYNYILWKNFNNCITQEEKDLFGLDVKKIVDIRYTIQHFDNLNPEGQSGKLNAKYVAALMLNSIGTNSKKEKSFVEYFNRLYVNHGKFKIVRVSAVNNAKNNMNERDKKEIMDSIIALINCKTRIETNETDLKLIKNIN